MSSLPISSRRVLVTGGSGTIGQAICLALAQQGYHVIVHAHHHRAQADTTVRMILHANGQAQAQTFDVTDDNAVHAALAPLLELGPIDALVHNAGIHDDAPMAGMRHQQWHQTINVSLNGFFHVTQPLLMPMARQRWGRIVAVSSVSAQLGNRGQTNYAAAKAGLHGACRSLAREMASRGITVNVVAPGIIESAMANSHFTGEMIRQLVPAGRAGQPQEVAALVAFLCSESASYINGQIIGINGAMA